VVIAGPRTARRAGAHRSQSSMMTGLMSRVRRADGELVPLRAAAARRRKSTSGGDAGRPGARRA
jgi:hypothetical protein